MWSFSLKMTGLKKNEDFCAVYGRGKKRADNFLVIYALDNDSLMNRVGISVSKKVGNSVVRHRIKRRLKEIARLSEIMPLKGMDYVVVARYAAKDATYDELRISFERLIAKLSKGDAAH